MEDKLMVICDGGAHTVEYLHKNGVFPSAIMIDTKKFQEVSPYLTKNHDILLIISSLTDFTMSEIYGLLAKFDENKEKFKRVTILSNVPLGAISYEYYLYSGDLFYGIVKKVVNKKIYDLDDNGNVIEDKKGLFNKNKVVQTRNPIMFQFKKYNDRKVRILVYGITEPVEKKELREQELKKAELKDLEYVKKIKLVDVFNNENKNMVLEEKDK